MKSHDYIIVGAGSAGCVLANRLTEEAGVTVLLLEAGKKDRHPLLKVPLAARGLWTDPRFNWDYWTEPEPYLNNRRIQIPRGKVLGGSSTINGLMHTRGHPRDYDQWRQMGLEGWGHSDVLPYFKRSETDSRGAGDYHGGSGPLQVNPYEMDQKSLRHALFQAASAKGYGLTEDFHGDQPIGFGTPDYTVGRGGRRSSTASAYLRPALARPGFRVETEALAHRVLFEQGRAVGVEYRRAGRLVTARAGREVILSGGSINSPQLLMLSGIGPGDDLAAHGIQVVHDAPAVGQNLHDHIAAGLGMDCAPEAAFDGELRFDKLTLSMIRWWLTGKGPASGLPLAGIAFMRTRPELERPDIEYLMSPVAPDARIWFPGLRKARGGYLICRIICLHPESRGALKLRSADPAQAPSLLYNFLQADADMDSLRAGLKAAREIFATEPLASLTGPETDPGPAVMSDAEIDAYIRQYSSTIFHPVATCAMGADEGAVVDGGLRVRGVEGLRVVDASVIPAVTGCNTNAPTIMIAEKAADMILGRDPLPAGDA